MEAAKPAAKHDIYYTAAVLTSIKNRHKKPQILLERYGVGLFYRRLNQKIWLFIHGNFLATGLQHIAMVTC